MINFSPLRTRRLSVTLRESSISNAINLALVPPELHERSTTDFLKHVVEAADTPSAYHIGDPRLWSVQERTMAVCHYLAHMTEPNFEVSGGRFLDYLNTKQDLCSFPILIGEVGGDVWEMIPLSGAAAEAIESLQGEIDGVREKFHWIVGAMAAQLQTKGSAEQDPKDFSAYCEWLKLRMAVFAAYPESQFVEMLAIFMAGSDKLGHLFNIDFVKDGIVWLPNVIEGSEAEPLPPARFPVSSCISEFAKRLSGKPTQ